MTLIKKIFKTLAVTALFSSANVLAADFLVDTTITDSIGDAHGPSGKEWVYEIEKMDVQWASNDLITVDVYTNFVDYNNEKGTGSTNGVSNGNIVLGDLLISTNGDNTPFNYAFVLSDTDRERKKYYQKSHWDNTGTLTEIDSTLTSKQYHNDSSSVQDGQVIAGNKIGTGIDSAWSVDRQNTGSNRDNYDVISFSFNVNGIDAFQNASQLAFSWAMSCANDMVHGVVNVNRPTSVPEPTTLLLMLLALVFIAKKHSKKANDFSA
ncbi:MAG TPA: hypothetical protein DEO86_13915 [Colwellia sp.]|nr:hypothetical protein [Colwellia sp.]